MAEKIDRLLLEQADPYFFEAMVIEEKLLNKWFEEKIFSNEEERVGAELEFQLVDKNFLPANINKKFIEGFDVNYSLATEAGQSNIEINTMHFPLHGNSLKKLEKNLSAYLERCLSYVKLHNVDISMTGLLFSVADSDLFIFTDELRYLLMDKKYSEFRNYNPLTLKIRGDDVLNLSLTNTSLVGATCAFQIHRQIKFTDSIRHYNAAQILSGPLLACCSNSPFILGKNLWSETRIPLLEQIASHYIHNGIFSRVNFGDFFLKNSWLELFIDNKYFPFLIPLGNPSVKKNKLWHLRLHNSTIYRWNRPVIGFSLNDKPHLRIEYRFMPSGPTVIDMISNAALLLGATHALVKQKIPLELSIHFSEAKYNFYQAARNGLNAKMLWKNEKIDAKEILTKIIIPLAYEGLRQMDIDEDDINLYLSIIKDRIRTNQTGTAWLRSFKLRHRLFFDELMAEYIVRQKKGYPVHEWSP